MNHTLEAMLVESCSPTLAGLKPANLFRCEETPELFSAVFAWNRKLQPSGLQIRVLKRCRSTGSCLIYVCRRAWVQQVLEQQEIRAFLSGEGYDMSRSMDQVLCQLARRLCIQRDFPHEIGIFLDYPLGDVIGFIVNQGRNFKCAGCWKVYCDECACRKTFAKYKKCRDVYVRLWQQGRSVLQLTVAA